MRVAALACSYRVASAIAATWLPLAFFTLEASAQSPSPSRVNPQQLGRQTESNDAERKRARKPTPVIRGLVESRPAASNVPLFKLRSVTIQGATVFSKKQIAKEYRIYLGRQVSQEDLQNISTSISDLYRKAGFHLSRAIVPSQDIGGGRLRIQIIEGSITDVQVKGSDLDQYGLKSYFSSLLSERPSRLQTVERRLLLANELPGVRISDAAFDEIGTASGQFRLIVTAETWRVFGTVGVDNSGTYAVGPLQAYSSLNLNSGFVAGDSLGVSASTVPDSVQDFRYGRASYDAPVGNDGARLGASGSFGEVRPDNAQRLVGARTTSQTFELRGSVVPLQAKESSLTLAAAVAYSDETNEDNAGLTYKDHARTISVAADYKLHDQLDGWNYVTLGVKQGLDTLGATATNDPLSSRTRASPNFAVYSFAYSRYQPLFGPWSIKGQVLGQMASGPVLSSQSFFLGGAGFGPGYYSGDNGVAGSLELRLTQTVGGKFLKSYQLY